MNALFITSENQYSVVSHFIQGMCEDLLALGIQSHTVNVSNLETADQQLLPLSHYQLLVSFNGVGLTLSVDGESIDSYMQQRPVFIFTVDHPIHLMDRFLGRNVIVLCVDQEHVAFCQLCGLQAVYFPHATSLQKLQQLDLVAWCYLFIKVLLKITDKGTVNRASCVTLFPEFHSDHIRLFAS